MKIKLYLKDSASAFTFDDVIDTYCEGNLFCVFLKDKIEKFPLQFIFRVTQIGSSLDGGAFSGKERRN